jgi:hypothetical protein
MKKNEDVFSAGRSLSPIPIKEDNMADSVSVFAPYSFQIGEKIRIEGPNRHGDWLVVAVDGDSVSLRCPVSGREFTWKNFCYLVRREEGAIWPQKD